ncbi:MAG: MFS transporter [Actinomycetota bacterium]
MSRTVTSIVVDAATAESFLRPRDGIVLERQVAPGSFEASEGPVHGYRRLVDVENLGDGRSRVTQTLEYRLALPFVGWLFALPVRRALVRGTNRMPWWAPPQRVDARGAAALSVLAAASAIGGYLTALLTASIAFAGRDFGAGAGAQGVAGVAARFGGAVALVVAAAAADRLGRRRVIVAAAVLGSLITALGAAAPSLPWLAASQAVARPFALAMLICVSIAAAEEMPAGSRAYAVSVLGLAGALGAGITSMLLPLADAAPWGWRLLYAAPVVALPVVASIGRRLPESRRFARPHPDVGMVGHGGRFWLLAASAMLLTVFATPASFFANRYLITEHGFSATAITAFTLGTGTPGVIGVVIGGRLADTRGRRPVGAFALTVGTVCAAMLFLASGAALWAWALLGSIVGSAALPALGVYGPELFPTGARGRAGGLLALAGLTGSAAGLLAVGFSADALGRLGPAIAWLSIGPLLVVALVLARYPETARRTLEELNPEDRTGAGGRGRI